MYVKARMTTNPFTVTPEATIADTLELMRSKNIRRVPVIKNEKLVGIITEKKLLEISPSPATSLSIFEINYLLSKTKISELMTKDVITVTPDTLVEIAATKMKEYDIGAIPVVENGKLVGIITESDIFETFIEIMGFQDTGSRIDVKAEEDKPGILAEVAAIIAGMNVNITHLTLYHDEITIRINTINPDPVIHGLQEKGYKVVAIYVNQ